MRPFASRAPDRAHAAYSMHTTARNLAQFMINIAGGKGLSKEAYQRMLKPAVRTDFDVGELDWPVYFGLGFQVMETPFGYGIGHSGSNFGNLSLLEYYPDQEAGFVLLTNGETGKEVYDALRQFLLVGEGQG